MTDEEWMTANPGVGSCDAPGTYTGDRIEELEDEIKRLNERLAQGEQIVKEGIALMDEKDAEIKRLREIEEAAREYRKWVWVPAVMVFAGVEPSGGYPVWRDYEDAQRKLDALLGKGEEK